MAHIRIGTAIITVENVDLAPNLCVRDILLSCIPYYMNDDRDAGYARSLGNFGISRIL